LGSKVSELPRILREYQFILMTWDAPKGGGADSPDGEDREWQEHDGDDAADDHDDNEANVTMTTTTSSRGDASGGADPRSSQNNNVNNDFEVTWGDDDVTNKPIMMPLDDPRQAAKRNQGKPSLSSPHKAR
jgi:hypothetical protein